MKNQVSEKRLKFNKELAKQFRIARATTGLRRKDVVSALDELPNGCVFSVIEDTTCNKSQKAIAFSQAEAILCFYEKYGYVRTPEMERLISHHSYIEKRINYVSREMKKDLKAKREAKSIEDGYLIEGTQGEPTVPTEDRFLREKVASLATDVSHIKKMINMIAKDLGLEK